MSVCLSANVSVSTISQFVCVYVCLCVCLCLCPFFTNGLSCWELFCPLLAPLPLHHFWNTKPEFRFFFSSFFGFIGFSTNRNCSFITTLVQNWQNWKLCVLIWNKYSVCHTYNVLVFCVCVSQWVSFQLRENIFNQKIERERESERECVSIWEIFAQIGLYQ